MDGSAPMSALFSAMNGICSGGRRTAYLLVRLFFQKLHLRRIWICFSQASDIQSVSRFPSETRTHCICRTIVPAVLESARRFPQTHLNVFRAYCISSILFAAKRKMCFITQFPLGDNIRHRFHRYRPRWPWSDRDRSISRFQHRKSAAIHALCFPSRPAYHHTKFPFAAHIFPVHPLKSLHNESTRLSGL